MMTRRDTNHKLSLHEIEKKMIISSARKNDLNPNTLKSPHNLSALTLEGLTHPPQYTPLLQIYHTLPRPQPLSIQTALSHTQWSSSSSNTESNSPCSPYLSTETAQTTLKETNFDKGTRSLTFSLFDWIGFPRNPKQLRSLSVCLSLSRVSP